MMKWLDSARARLRLLFARRAAESRMEREFRFHIDMETDALMRTEGLAPDDARRRAIAAFGGVERHKETMRWI
jgi:putative ABC transport system permease protein